MTRKETEELLSRYAAGTATPEERALVERYFLHYLDNREGLPDEKETGRMTGEAFRAIQEHTVAKRGRVILIRRWSVAASIAVAVSVGAYFALRPHEQAKPVQQLADIRPTGNKAILTLANGQQIVLTGAQNGKLAQQGAISITKTKNGELVYQPNASAPSQPPALNELATLDGGKYHLVLPDGTQVWINAQSKLRYPATFSGKEREVELDGEAYFEVAKNKAMPFHVKTAANTITVLGTHFNVMAYQDEATTETTLLEGSVQVDAKGKQLLIKPGQQAKLANSAGELQLVKDPDTEQIIAWKDDLFEFNNTPVAEVARQIERWYNVKVNYAGTEPGRTFTAILPRNSSLANITHKLELTGGIKFSLQGDQLNINSTKR